ncbi:MAG: hypothetical protein GY769_23090 [bacterium]|nr:hypothetical protein [bacterium]
MRHPSLPRLIAVAALATVAACGGPTPDDDGRSETQAAVEPLRIAFIAYQNPDQLLERRSRSGAARA